MFNNLKLTVLLALLTGLFIAIGNSLGGQSGAAFAFILAMVMNIGSYWFSDKLVLKLTGAREVTQNQAPEFYNIVKKLAQNANLPMPKLYIVNKMEPNAFATGRDPQHAAVAATQGLLNMLSPNEISAVMAHELAHVQNRDTLISAIAATIAGAISMLANIAQWSLIFGGRNDNRDNPVGSLVAIFIAPLAATLIQLAISRSREFEADKVGSKIHGNPLDLASALQKIHQGIKLLPAPKTDPALSHLFIMSPFSGKKAMNLFMTHPPVEERIQRLQSYAKS